MKIFSLTFVTILLACSILFGQISLIGSGTYSEDFNTLAITGTSSIVPIGWAFSEGGTNANTTYTAGTGSSTTGDTYSFGAASLSERAFGGLRSGTLIPIIGVSFINNTGSIISQLPITYIGEQWRAGVTNRGAADRLDFQLSTDATSLITGTWTDYDALDFQSPNINTTAGALDGNAAGNRTSVSSIITGLNIINGSTFWIRWTDFDITSSDDGLAIDDFSIDETNLPVELSSYSAIVLDNSVRLNWRTETEVNNYGFEIIRSAQNDIWDKIGFVQGHGNSNSPKDYSFIDESVAGGKYFYKLKQVDTDGKFEYSKVIEVDLGSPAKFELSQNYPNPFNPVTTIRFTLPQPGNVKLILFNILGEQVAELVNEFKDAGVHTINLNASELNSGLYIYKIESNGFVQSRKMMLLK
jgi:hypothetical protein